MGILLEKGNKNGKIINIDNYSEKTGNPSQNR